MKKKAKLDYTTVTRSFDTMDEHIEFLHKMIYEHQKNFGNKPDYVIMQELDFHLLVGYLAQSSLHFYNSNLNTVFGCEIIKANVPYPICGKK